MPKNEPGPISLPYTQIKCIKDLSMRLETIKKKILEESTGRHFSDFGCSNILLVMSLEPREIKQE